jgi:hypothetical protein
VSALLAIVPWYWRWAAVAALVAAVLGYGYLRGYLHEERKFDIYQAEVDALAKEAAKRAAARKAEQDKNTKEVRDGWKGDVASIHAYYASHPRVVRLPAGSCAMPAAADDPGRADGPSGEPAVARHDPELEQRCALDAARINRWRELAMKNGLPVR